MKEVILTIKSNIKVSSDTYRMVLCGDLSSIKNPGEFINIKLEGYYLRRPISVCEFTTDSVTILYKILGHGTLDMSKLNVNTKLNCLVNLGNGFDVTKAKKPLIVAGGIGIAPLIGLMKEFNKLNIKPILVYGARSKNDIVLNEELEKLAEVHYSTDDGSLGFKGNVVSCIKNLNPSFDYYYACGPQIMLKFLTQDFKNGCVSLEARMGCGFGACMGCSINTINGPKRVCKEGPVFEASEVIL